MPYPAQTDRATILAHARRLLEKRGAAGLALSEVAAAAGIKAPSLYRHVANKPALLVALIAATLDELFASYAAAQRTAGPEPAAQLVAILHAHHTFALAHPQSYLLAFSSEQRPDEAWLTGLVLPLQALLAAVVGAADALAALRGALALAHGFAVLEINGQLRRGGDLGADYDAAITAYLAGWAARGAAAG